MTPSPQQTSSDAGGESGRSPVWSVLRWLGLLMGGLIGLVLVVLLVVLLLLQTRWGAEQVRQLAIDHAPLQNAELQIERLGGSFVRSLQAYDVSLVHEDGHRMAHVDTLTVSYRLLPLLRGELDIREARVVGPDVNARQLEDGSWDLVQAFPEGDPETETELPFDISVRRAELTGGEVIGRFYPPEADSMARVEELNLLLRDFLLSEEALSFRLDTLRMQSLPPGSPDMVDFRLGAALDQDSLSVSELVVSSPRSNVNAEGLIVFPADGTEDTDFTLTADPLAFSDLQPFLPMLDPEVELFMEGSLSGNMQLLHADLDGRFSDEGTFSFTAELTPGTDPGRFERLRYVLDGRFRNIDPGVFMAHDPSMTGTFNADVEADLEGPRLQELDGTLRAEVFDTRVAHVVPEPTTLQVDFSEGAGELSLTTGIDGSHLTTTGTVRPFDEVPAYALSTEFVNLDAGAFSEEEDFSTSITGVLDVDGRGLALDTARVNLVLDLEPSTINEFRLQQGHMRLALNGGRGGMTLSLRPETEGFLLAGGSVDLRDEPAYAVHIGRIQNLDVAALTGDPTPSSLNATFTLEGQGFDPETLELDHAQFDLLPSHYGEFQLETASLEASIQDAQASFSGEAEMEGGGFQIEGTSQPFGDVVTVNIPQASFQNVDIGRLAQIPDQRSNVSGSASLSLRGTDPETMELDAQLQLASSQLNDQPIDEGSMVVNLQQGRLNIESSVEMPESSLQLAATGRFFDDVVQYEVTEASFDEIDLGALAGQPDFATSLSGSGSLEGEGTDPETMTLEAHLELLPSLINEVSLMGGVVDASLTDGRARLDGQINFERGTATLEGEGRFLEDPATYSFIAALDEVAVAELAGREDLGSSLTLRMDVEGEGLDTETMTLSGWIETHHAQVENVIVNQADAAFSYDAGLLQVDTLVVRSNILSASGTGPVAVVDPESQYRSNFRFEGEVTDLTPIGELMESDIGLVEGGFEGRLYGAPGRLGFESSASLSGFAYNDIRIGEIEIITLGEFDQERELDIAEVRTTLDTITLPTLVAQGAHAEFLFDGEQVAIETDLTIGPRRTVELVGLVDLVAEDPIAHITTFDMAMEGDQWSLLREATITLGEPIRVRNFLLYAQDQQIAVDGTVNFAGEQNLLITLESVRIDPFAALLGYEGLGGRVSGLLDLLGPAGSPRMQGELSADLTAYDDSAGDLTVDLMYENLELAIDVGLAHDDGSTLSLVGTLPLDLRLDRAEPFDVASGEIDMRLRSDAFSVAWVRPFLDPETVDRLDGQFTADVQITGTRADPSLSGRATLSNGLIRLPALGVQYNNIAGVMLFDDDQLRLQEFTMRSARRGRLTAEGTIDMTDLTIGEFDLTVQTRDFLAINTREYRVVADSDLTVTGTTTEPVVQGSVTLISADIFIDQPSAELEPVELTQEDVQIVEQRFGIRVTPEEREAFDIYEAANIELTIQMERDVWVRSRSTPEMNIQITGALEFEKAPNEDETAFGEISVVPERSFINQFGRRFDIESGSLVFTGPVADPIMDIEAVFNVQRRRGRETEVSIRLSVEGTLDELDIELLSDPPMETTDIVSYIITGRPASEGFMLGGQAGESTDLVEEGIGLAVGQVAGFIEQFAGRELGLDVIEIDQQRDQGTTITAGRFVTRRLFVSVSQPISLMETPASGPYRSRTFTPSVMLEYSLFDFLLARIAREETGLRINFLWEYAY